MYPEFKQHIAELTQFMSDNGVDAYPLPKVVLNKQPQATNPIFQTTGYYDPQIQCITLYVHNRHPKDVLRTYAHELVHHSQNINGSLNVQAMENANDPQYAQNDPHLRKMEEDANLRGSMLFRDWTDTKKYNK